MLDRLFEVQHQRRQVFRVGRIADPSDQLARFVVFGLRFADHLLPVTQPIAKDRIDCALLGARMCRQLVADSFRDRRILARLELREELLHRTMILLDQFHNVCHQ